MTSMRILALVGFLTAAVMSMSETIAPKVVVVAMFEPGKDTGDAPGEFQLWVERLKLDKIYSLPSAYHDVRSNADGSVIGIVTGVGNTRAAATIMALGSDPRFDLSKSYWLVAGIAGIDPADASVGSAAWAEWIVNGDLGHEIDPREIPPDWPTGYVPLRKGKPYEQPHTPDDTSEVFHLDPGLVNWAYELTKNTPLQDTDALKARRALYVGFPNAQRPPFVLKGDTLSSETYWHGKLMNEWANRWVDYHTSGKGRYVTTAMEDIGTYQSLAWLSRAGKADVHRLLVLRTASNFDRQWPATSAAESMFGEKLSHYSAYMPSLEAAFQVGNQVVQAILTDWEKFKVEPPGAKQP
jgi:purine nucleoside permease